MDDKLEPLDAIYCGSQEHISALFTYDERPPAILLALHPTVCRGGRDSNKLTIAYRKQIAR